MVKDDLAGFSNNERQNVQDMATDELPGALKRRRNENVHSSGVTTEQKVVHD